MVVSIAVCKRRSRRDDASRRLPSRLARIVGESSLHSATKDHAFPSTSSRRITTSSPTAYPFRVFPLFRPSGRAQLASEGVSVVGPRRPVPLSPRRESFEPTPDSLRPASSSATLAFADVHTLDLLAKSGTDVPSTLPSSRVGSVEAYVVV